MRISDWSSDVCSSDLNVAAMCTSTIAQSTLSISIVPLQPGLSRFALRGIGSLACLSEAVGNKHPEAAGPNERFWHWNKASERLLAMWSENYLLAQTADDPRTLYEDFDDSAQHVQPARKWPVHTAASSQLWGTACREKTVQYATEASKKRLAVTRHLRRQHDKIGRESCRERV